MNESVNSKAEKWALWNAILNLTRSWTGHPLVDPDCNPYKKRKSEE
ncbi:MAG: hypothetical protein Q4D26_11460 [Clostridia bacterium]|nr:hypothetical protein [Clostridia bacterium]